MTQPKLLEALPFPIYQRRDAELLRETLQLARTRRPFIQIHEMTFDPALGEEPQRLPGVRALLRAEDLDLHLRVCLGGWHQATAASAMSCHVCGPGPWYIAPAAC